MGLDGCWKVTWSNVPRFGKAHQRFTAFSKLPPKLVKVRDVSQCFDNRTSKISQSACLYVVDDACNVQFTLHGSYKEHGHALIASFDMMELTPIDEIPVDWSHRMPSGMKVPVSMPPSHYQHIVMHPTSRVVRSGPYLTVFQHIDTCAIK